MVLVRWTKIWTVDRDTRARKVERMRDEAITCKEGDGVLASGEGSQNIQHSEDDTRLRWGPPLRWRYRRSRLLAFGFGLVRCCFGLAGVSV
ncbi:hypothetical protein C3L33_22783, partial [Rhododendron williamsianum]